MSCPSFCISYLYFFTAGNFLFCLPQFFRFLCFTRFCFPDFCLLRFFCSLEACILFRYIFRFFYGFFPENFLLRLFFFILAGSSAERTEKYFFVYCVMTGRTDFLSCFSSGRTFQLMYFATCLLISPQIPAISSSTGSPPSYRL